MNGRARLFALGLVAAVLAGCSNRESPMAPSTPPEALATPPPSPQLPAPAPPATARYRVTFDATWSQATHPVEYPATAHFSPLVGATHTGSVRFWSGDVAATPGIRAMAEGGRTAPLSQEVSAAIAAGTAERVLLGGAINGPPASVSFEFEASQAFPLVTLVTMIAPSPDWFVGVSGLPLFENGQWVQERRLDLVPWDAGTDSGATFESADVVTTPAHVVSPIVTAPLSPSGRITTLGTFTFTRRE
jgi:hypothetical protein